MQKSKGSVEVVPPKVYTSISRQTYSPAQATNSLIQKQGASSSTISMIGTFFEVPFRDFSRKTKSLGKCGFKLVLA